MATYNRGRHILPSIRSVLQQRYRDFELVIVGDCCTDGTEDAVQPLLSDRIRWFNLTERCGTQSFPNNEGIARSTGRYIAYLGHDDIWTPDHLQSLAVLFDGDSELDFAISGAIYHGPPGSDFRQVTGIFSDPAAAFEHFFPPSSLAHRRDVTDRIGPWAHPLSVSAPVDADIQQRAAQAGMHFRSTQRITLHKFAAGHRYLSYLEHDSAEQEAMLRKLEAPDYQAMVASEVDRAKACNSFMIVRQIDFRAYEKGALATASAMRRGATRPTVRPLERREAIVQDDLSRSLDWKEAQHPGGRTRWSYLNPRPKILIPYTFDGSVRIDFTVAHADGEALGRLALRVNGTALDASLSPPRRNSDGIFEATATVTAALRPGDPTIVELQLTEAQRPNGKREGLGVGEIVLTPPGWQSLTGRARSFAGRLLRRLT